MSLVAIRNALQSHLNALTPALSTAWESVPFTPVVNTPYQQVNLMMADNKNIVVSDPSYIAVGFMQVLLVYPPNKSANLAEIRADLLTTHFKCGTKLTSGGLDVLICKTPQTAPALIDGSSYKLPVTIHFKSFISL